jgi:hypothetical protein
VFIEIFEAKNLEIQGKGRSAYIFVGVPECKEPFRGLSLDLRIILKCNVDIWVVQLEMD